MFFKKQKYSKLLAMFTQIEIRYENSSNEKMQI